MKRRIVLKLSGEAMAGPKGVGLDPKTISDIALEIKRAYDSIENIELAIVVGGGNIWRGKVASDMGMERSSADYMGMLATVMNALALQNSLELLGIDTRTLTSMDIPTVAEPYIRRRALRHLEKGRIVIFGGGTGNPYFSTDTTAALRAAEINADTIYMAKNGVDGVYDMDPKKHDNAIMFKKITHKELLEKDLGVMDLTASTLCSQNGINIHVFNMNVKGNIKKAIDPNTRVGTLITN